MFDLPLDDLPLDDFTQDDLSPSAGCEPVKVLFENADWRVAADGLEHRGTGYFIARETIAQRRGDLWEWPMHLAEKSWCTPRSFREAFLAAVTAFGIETDSGLSQSFAMAFGLVAGTGTRRGEAGFVALGDQRGSAGDAACWRAGGFADGRGGTPARRSLRLFGSASSPNFPAAIQDVFVRRDRFSQIAPGSSCRTRRITAQTPRRSKVSTAS
jgi:hypothetical protein